MWVLFQPEYIWISSFFILIVHSWGIFQLYSWREQINFQWDDDEVRFELDQHA